MSRRAAITLTVLALGLLVLVVVARSSDASSRAADAAPAAGHAGAAARGNYWAGEYRRRWLVERRDGRARARTIRSLRRTLRHDGRVVEAINLACATYPGVGCQTLWRKASCETGGTFARTAFNRSSGASGLFQFLPSTFASTPYARFSIWSPYANALAAAWMHTAGRGGEWACR